MERDVFDRETLLDLTVNVIPLGIILFFVLLFIVVAPWGYSLVATASQMSLLVVPFAALALLTYYSGKAIARDEEKLEADAEAEADAEGDGDAELEVGASPALKGDETGDEASDESGGETAAEASDESPDESPEPATNEALDDG